LQELGGRLEREKNFPFLFLEYAAGLEPAWFVEVMEGASGRPSHGSAAASTSAMSASAACTSFAHQHPGLELWTLSAEDDRLPALATDVQRAIETALPTVLEMSARSGRWQALALHLHDGLRSSAVSPTTSAF